MSIRVLQSVGPHQAQTWATRFGFDAEKHPPYLTLALRAGSVTPLQMASACSVFANGGYRVNPMLISRVTDSQGRGAGDQAARIERVDAGHRCAMRS